MMTKTKVYTGDKSRGRSPSSSSSLQILWSFVLFLCWFVHITGQCSSIWHQQIFYHLSHRRASQHYQRHQYHAAAKAKFRTCSKLVRAKFHYTRWFGASSELASVMEFGFYSFSDELNNCCNCQSWLQIGLKFNKKAVLSQGTTARCGTLVQKVCT